jgi:plastocyanin
MHVHRLPAFAILAAGLLGPASALAAESFTLSIRDHRFEPAELEVPAGKKFTLVVKNEDATPEEFESKTLKREKIISGRSQAVIHLGPLEAGSYDFVGEFHEATAKGRIVAK